MKKVSKIKNAYVTWCNKRAVFRAHRILEDGSHQWFRNSELVCLEDVSFVESMIEGQLAAIGTMVLPKRHVQKNDKRVWFRCDPLQGTQATKAMLMIHGGIKRHQVVREPEVRLQGGTRTKVE